MVGEAVTVNQLPFFPLHYGLQTLHTPTCPVLSPFFSNFCALFCTYANLNSFLLKRFRTLCQKPPGVGYSQRSTFNLQTFKRSERPIAAERPWCNNERRHENSSRSGETTPLPPVSKDRERTSGTARSWSPMQVVPGYNVLTPRAF
jgi:hypothetical protein